MDLGQTLPSMTSHLLCPKTKCFLDGTSCELIPILWSCWEGLLSLDLHTSYPSKLRESIKIYNELT